MQLLRITTRQQIVANKAEKICLQALDRYGNNIRPKESAKILGLTVNSNLNWIGHLSKGKDSIISKCKAKRGALKFAAKNSYFVTKKKTCRHCNHVKDHLLHSDLGFWGQ